MESNSVTKFITKYLIINFILINSAIGFAKAKTDLKPANVGLANHELTKIELEKQEFAKADLENSKQENLEIGNLELARVPKGLSEKDQKELEITLKQTKEISEFFKKNKEILEMPPDVKAKLQDKAYLRRLNRAYANRHLGIPGTTEWDKLKNTKEVKYIESTNKKLDEANLILESN